MLGGLRSGIAQSLLGRPNWEDVLWGVNPSMLGGLRSGIGSNLGGFRNSVPRKENWRGGVYGFWYGLGM